MRAKLTAPRFTAYLALVCVCFFWGTTYLGIRIGVSELPPATLMCVRYLFSGSVLLIGAKLRGAYIPRGRELWGTALYGVMIIAVGTGALTFAEVWIPSGLASLFVTTGSFWLVAAEAAMPGGEPLHAPTIGAMLIGACGAGLLVAPGAGALEAPSQVVGGFVLIQIGYMSWAIGSILQRRQRSKAHPIVSAAVQQFAAGAAFILPALLQPQPTHWTARGLGATLYLAVFGGIIGYSAYVITMTRLPVAIASIYSYINPLVAVLLGVWLYGEQFSAREGIAMGIIFAGVGLVKRAQRGR
ncbi:MAG TPA: EamA family transporter [Bryobacteraceae bacterium]|jgi:drug/metabolite transporter (DMT)-like permease